MRILQCFLFILLAQGGYAHATHSQPEWNPDGRNLYRLVRADEPAISERFPEQRIARDLAELVNHTRSADLPEDVKQARLRAIANVRRILTNARYHTVYDLFRTALGSGRKLQVAESFVPPQPETLLLPRMALPVTLNEAPGAGLVHYALFVEFLNETHDVPELEPTSTLELGRSLDRFLSARGVTGFGAYAEPLLSNFGKTDGVWTLFKEHLRSSRLAFAVGMISCAALLGANQAYQHYFAEPPQQRLEQKLDERRPPQEAADKQVDTLVKETLPLLQPPSPSTPKLP